MRAFSLQTPHCDATSPLSLFPHALVRALRLLAARVFLALPALWLLLWAGHIGTRGDRLLECENENKLVVPASLHS